MRLHSAQQASGNVAGKLQCACSEAERAWRAMKQCTSLGGMRASVSEYRYSCFARGAIVFHACHTCRPLSKLNNVLQTTKAVRQGQAFGCHLRIQRAECRAP